MSEIIVSGKNKLQGEICISGAKNSALPIIAATLLCDGVSIIKNCPDISDVSVCVQILEYLGCVVSRTENEITVDPRSAKGDTIPQELMCKMRSSIVFLGAILGKMKSASVCMPGGCNLGPRPIDIHISSLSLMGVKVCDDRGCLNFSGDIIGADIMLPFASVGATENIILAAVKSNGKTTIRNAAKEPEIVDLIDFLSSAGADISGAGSDTIVINGVDKLCGVTHSVIPDRIETATFLSAAAITSSNIKIVNANYKHLYSVIDVFKQSGCEFHLSDNSVEILPPKRLKAVRFIRTGVYPAFPTDAGPVVAASLCLSCGTTVYIENIFENRFGFVSELNRMGADIRTEGKVAVIKGVASLNGSNCTATDLRSGAALIVASLAANGDTKISDVQHIYRGYEKITEKLQSIGAKIYEEY